MSKDYFSPPVSQGAKSLVERRKKAYWMWKEKHPDGVTKDSIFEFKKFMKGHDK